jgi:FKBP-type peptidyl-prolyl cis-trans isomerase FklB|tara:strand:- start:287 stop:988 length:702 start_codon:yes stop_codon:yes gene_type:complete
MKITLLKWAFVAFGGLIFVSCAEKEENKRVELKTEMDSLSYAFGVDIGTNLQNNDIEGINPDALLKGMMDNQDGGGIMTKEEASKFIQEFFAVQAKAKSASAKREANNFLQENASREGVVVTESGLQYEILTVGTGTIPTFENKVSVHYHGTLLDGTVFDSSVDRGQPAQFPVGGVIKGWTEALMIMPVGSKWKLFIPSDLAYGDRGAGEKIGPGSTLIFEVELLEILPADAQ